MFPVAMATRAGQIFFSSRVSRVGGKTNQIEPLRLGPGSFASNLSERFRFEISKFVQIFLSTRFYKVTPGHHISEITLYTKNIIKCENLLVYK